MASKPAGKPKGPAGAEKARAAPPEEKAKADEEKPNLEGPSKFENIRRKLENYKREVKSSNYEFWSNGNALLKLLSMIFLCVAYVGFHKFKMYSTMASIILLEVIILIVFFGIYSFAINRYVTFILWTASDVINSVCATVFLLVVFVVLMYDAIFLPEFSKSVIFIGWAVLFYLIAIYILLMHLRRDIVKNKLLVPPKETIQMAKK